MRIAMRYWLHGCGYHNAVRAMEFAYKYHTGIRKDGETPEFHHQVSITSYLRTLHGLKYQEEVLAVAFLHDIIEDHQVDLKVIFAEFGDDITRAVKLLTKKNIIEAPDIETYFDSMSGCPIASIVKGGDRIHNFQTMIDIFTPEKKQKYIDECETYILPMLKEARRRFPEQEPAYENIKLVLMSHQIELINVSLSAMRE
jgi:(p)ppGpp synthase/HD superfamily hydrolase